MLQMQATSILSTDEGDLLPGAYLSEEGLALAYVKHDGKLFLQPSLGLADEVFAGFYYGRPTPANFKPRVQEFVLGTDDIVLARLPHPDQLLIKIDGVVASKQNAGDQAPEIAGEVTVNGAELLFAAADVAAKKKVFVQYLYELTASEAKAETGDEPIGGISANIRGRAPYIKTGEVGTTMFDATSDWGAADAMHPRLGAGGRLTLKGSGKLLTNVLIKSAPSTQAQYLVLEVK